MTQVFTKSWSPSDLAQSTGRALRKPRKIELRRIGRQYTHATYLGHVPHSLRFNTVRAAKKFFSQSVVVIKSVEQMGCMYGCPAFNRLYRPLELSGDLVKSKLEALGISSDFVKEFVDDTTQSIRE